MRKRRAVKRDVLPDALYKSKVVTKLINQIMFDGKKGTAQRIVYDAFDMIKEKTGEDAMVVFEKAMANIKPNITPKIKPNISSQFIVVINLCLCIGLLQFGGGFVVVVF